MSRRGAAGAGSQGSADGGSAGGSVGTARRAFAMSVGSKPSAKVG